MRWPLWLACLVGVLGCGGRWWRRKADGLLLQEPLGTPFSEAVCPWTAGGSQWAEVTLPSEELPEIWAGQQHITLTVELSRGSVEFYELHETAENESAALFAENGKRCVKPKPLRAPVCTRFGPGADLSAVSDAIGQRFCEHPEAKDARALFCRYPPRFYGHAGICQQYAQFCPFEELNAERDASRINLAVVNVDAEMFYSLEECGAFQKEFWIFKVYVHWCPHCQQLMPKLYRLALQLQQHGVTSLRFGAVNCATEHQLCTEQGWLGHPLLVAKYLGPDTSIHGAIEHWVDVVKDAQLRQMLPRYALPGEFPVLKILLEHLPSTWLPHKAWAPLFDPDSNADRGACANITALHPEHEESVNEPVGNAWHDVERNFTVKRRWTDALIMLRHVFQEWIAPVGDDGNVDAFSYSQLMVMEAFVVMLIRNLPHAFQLQAVLRELHAGLILRVRQAHGSGGSSLCASEWKSLTSNVIAAINEVGQRDFAFPSACASDTCRMWSLLHILASEGFRRSQLASELEVPPVEPHVMLRSLQGFLDHFFKCHYCRRHFLRQYEEGSYGLREARESYKELVLYLWRFHNAVSLRVSALHSCVDSDRRWPPTWLCSSCWGDGGGDRGDPWPVLAEAKALAEKKGIEPRFLKMIASPNEPEILNFLQSNFLA